MESETLSYLLINVKIITFYTKIEMFYNFSFSDVDLLNATKKKIYDIIFSLDKIL